MMTRISIALICLVLRWSSYLAAQGLERSSVEVRVEGAAGAIFKDIQHGLRTGDVSVCSRYLARQVYLNLPGRDGGYFSENQAAYVLKEFFVGRRALSFTFSTISDQEANTFATGGGTFFRRGNAEILQVYVALKKSGDRWLISQFSVF